MIPIFAQLTAKCAILGAFWDLSIIRIKEFSLSSGQASHLVCQTTFCEENRRLMEVFPQELV